MRKIIFRMTLVLLVIPTIFACSVNDNGIDEQTEPSEAELQADEEIAKQNAMARTYEVLLSNLCITDSLEDGTVSRTPRFGFPSNEPGKYVVIIDSLEEAFLIFERIVPWFDMENVVTDGDKTSYTVKNTTITFTQGQTIETCQMDVECEDLPDYQHISFISSSMIMMDAKSPFTQGHFYYNTQKGYLYFCVLESNYAGDTGCLITF